MDRPRQSGRRAAARRERRRDHRDRVLAVPSRRPDGPSAHDATTTPCSWRQLQQLTAYFARELKEFDLPLAPHGTAFQQRVWEQLKLVGYGETASYGEIAAPARQDQRGLARRRPGQRPQPDPDRDPVPPDHRRQRHPHRLRRRPGAQADAAPARAGRAVLSADDAVWYAGYGSNLDPDRFGCYLLGGCPPGATRTYPGTRARVPALDVRPFAMPGRLVFAWQSADVGRGDRVPRPDRRRPGAEHRLPAAGRDLLGRGRAGDVAPARRRPRPHGGAGKRRGRCSAPVATRRSTSPGSSTAIRS